jgi:hypothetical protein
VTGSRDPANVPKVRESSADANVVADAITDLRKSLPAEIPRDHHPRREKQIAQKTLPPYLVDPPMVFFAARPKLLPPLGSCLLT